MSSMGLNLQLDETYDLTKMIEFKPFHWTVVWFYRLMVPFMIPSLIKAEFKRKIDRNPLHDGKRALTGKKKVALSDPYNFAEIKATSKILKVTINELLSASLAVALKRLFEERGDTKTDTVQLAMPVNIRWGPYATYDDVKLENKFSPMPIKLPLHSDHEESLKLVKPVTSKMRSDFKKTYATYFIAICIGYFMPAWLARINCDILSKPVTLAFSNIPGILKKIKYKDVETLGQCTCFVAAGRCAISVCLMSYCENIRYSVLMDSCVDGEPKDIVRHFDGAIRRFIEIGKEKSHTEQAKKEN